MGKNEHTEGCIDVAPTDSTKPGAVTCPCGKEKAVHELTIRFANFNQVSLVGTDCLEKLKEHLNEYLAEGNKTEREGW